MLSALGKVRTAGTFSFVVGVVAYFALATGFALWAGLKGGVYKNWILFAAGIALLIGIVVSGSRSVVGACAVVGASLLIVLFVRPALVNRIRLDCSCFNDPWSHRDEHADFSTRVDGSYDPICRGGGG